MPSPTARPARHPTALEVVDGHDLGGREAVVTGGASGLGYQTARALAAAGARVVLAVRDVTRASAAAAALRRLPGGPQVDLAPLRLDSLASVRSFVAWYQTTGRPLHLLVNNAGIMATPLSYTQDGFESQFGVNYLGHFALSVGLLPALRAAGQARVVVLSSAAHRRSDIDFADIHFRRRPYDPFVAYGQSKTADALLAVAFSRRYATDGVTANAVHPGAIMTGLQRHLSRQEQVARGFIDQAGRVNPRWKTPEQGAATSVWAAVAPELAGVAGRYLEDCHIAGPWAGQEPFTGYMPYAMDPQRADRLWQVSAGQITATGAR